MTLSLKRRSFFNLFPTPEYLLLTSAGISINSAKINLVELKKELFGSGFKLEHASKVITPKGALEAGIIRDKNALVESIKKLDSRHNLRYINATLPDEKAYLFSTNIGKVPNSGLRDAVAFAAEENVPIPLSESVFDFDIIGELPESNELKVSVIVMPKSVVESFVDLFESLGMTPVSFDTESQAISRAIVHRGDKRCIFIINLFPDRTGFYVIENEVVQFSTTSQLSVSEDNTHNLNDIKAEINKVFAYWNSRTDKSGNPERKIEKVLLSGSGSISKKLVEKLMEESKAEYSVADVWLNTSPDRSYVSEIEPSESLDCAAAIGLVLPRKGQSYV